MKIETAVVLRQSCFGTEELLFCLFSEWQLGTRICVPSDQILSVGFFVLWAIEFRPVHLKVKAAPPSDLWQSSAKDPMGEPAGKSSSVGSESSNELDSEEEFSGLAQLDEIALDNLQSEPAQDADASDSGDEIKANNVPEIQTEETSLSPAFLLSQSDKLLDKCLPQFVDFLADFGSSESFL
eukprot:174231-Rhodomonas_salina.1